MSGIPPKARREQRALYKKEKNKKASVRDSYKADPEKKKASIRDSYKDDIESKRSAKMGFEQTSSSRSDCHIYAINSSTLLEAGVTS